MIILKTLINLQTIVFFSLFSVAVKHSVKSVTEGKFSAVMGATTPPQSADGGILDCQSEFPPVVETHQNIQAPNMPRAMKFACHAFSVTRFHEFCDF